MKAKIYIVTALLIVLVPISVAAKNETPASSGQNLIASETQVKKNAKAVANCEKVQTKLQEKAAVFQKNKQGHTLAYQNAYDRISKVISKYEALGYDVTKLKTDLEVLKTKIDAFNEGYNAYLAQLQTLKNDSCDKTSTEFKNSLSQTRTKLQAMRNLSLEVRNYFNDTIKSDLLALKKQVMEKAQNTVEADSSDQDATDNSQTSSTDQTTSQADTSTTQEGGNDE